MYGTDVGLKTCHLKIDRTQYCFCSNVWNKPLYLSGIHIIKTKTHNLSLSHDPLPRLWYTPPSSPPPIPPPSASPIGRSPSSLVICSSIFVTADSSVLRVVGRWFTAAVGSPRHRRLISSLSNIITSVVRSRWRWATDYWQHDDFLNLRLDVVRVEQLRQLGEAAASRSCGLSLQVHLFSSRKETFLYSFKEGYKVGFCSLVFWLEPIPSVALNRLHLAKCMHWTGLITSTLQMHLLP